MTLDGQALIKDPEAAGPGLLQRQDLATSNQSRTALEHPTLKRILNIVFASSSAGEDSGRGSHDTSPPADDRPVPLIAPHPYKWLRAVGPGGNTGPHVDRVYFPDLHTIWIPLGDVPTNLGSMIVARRSHKSPAFTTFQDAQSRKTLGKDGTHSGYATNDPNDIAELFDVQPRAALEWVTDDVEMGDVVVLHNRTLHMTATNTMEPPTWRISCDTRWFIDSPES
ncbi:hypothetical protein HKX48_007292 [Thoreauomyces humboldtii]|nr:hypothetical protein HKX48_007292 [Thoreauomyces humboldtii]